jgi:hypothetical protein
MQRRLRARLWYLAFVIATIGLGLSVHLRATMLSTVARDVLGDVLWAVMSVWCVSVVVPAARLLTRGAVALAVCWAVEASQLYHAPTVDALRATMVGHLVLGSGFDPRDLAAYAAGVLAAALLEAGVSRRRGTSHTAGVPLRAAI